MTRVAVIGAGAMGRNHVRVYREMPTVQLVAVVDVDSAVSKQIAAFHGVPTYSDHLEMIERERPDAISIAVPTRDHYEVVRDALEHGCHVLVEKPIAATLAQASALIEIARIGQRILMVGHIERFNPAVLALKRRLADGQLGRVFQMHARRLGPFPKRIRDVGVVVDLATHDLDLMRYLSCSEARAVYAETKREVNTANEDLLDGIVRFHDGMLGLLEINWLTPTKIRELCITGERGMFRVDYLTQDLYFFENAQIGDGEWQPLSVLRGGVKEGTMTRFALDKKEPLRSELETFVDAVAGQDRGVVTGQDGLEALRLALALIESAGVHQVVEVSRLNELASV